MDLNKEDHLYSEIGDAPFTDLNVFWGIGCMAVEAYQKLEKMPSDANPIRV